jgi:hypothetical protein
MQRNLIAAVSLVVFVLLVFVAARTVRKRAAKQGDLELSSTDQLAGVEIAEASGLYLATVLTAEPLVRLLAKELRNRGKARLSVLSDGLIIDRTGEPSITITAQNLCSVSRSSATIDRGVEGSGLLSICWMAANKCLTTNFRLAAEDDTQDLFDKISDLAKKVATA